MHPATRHFTLTFALLVFFHTATVAHADLRIAFIDPAMPKETPQRNAAALAFARTMGNVVRLQPQEGSGWRDERGGMHAPEEFDVLWYHEGDDPKSAQLGETCCADLLAYV